jgi:hypothetical protein
MPGTSTPRIGRGISRLFTDPYLPHSSLTSSRISTQQHATITQLSVLAVFKYIMKCIMTHLKDNFFTYGTDLRKKCPVKELSGQQLSEQDTSTYLMSKMDKQFPLQIFALKHSIEETYATNDSYRCASSK